MDRFWAVIESESCGLSEILIDSRCSLMNDAAEVILFESSSHPESCGKSAQQQERHCNYAAIVCQTTNRTEIVCFRVAGGSVDPAPAAEARSKRRCARPA